LILVLGDQLDLEAAAFDGFDASQDAVWMAEAYEESTHVWSSKQRITLFLSAMRHFAQALRDAGRPLHYHRLDDNSAVADLDSLGAKLQADLVALVPQRVVMTAPGDWRVFQQLKATVKAAGLKLEVCEDRHFFTTVSEFAAHASGRKSLRLEYFYRELRQRHNILMEDGKPAGGQWNFDADNREAFGPQGPGPVPVRATFKHDARMGGPCKGRRYDPALREGERACPYTTLYGDFLMRHEILLAKNARMTLQVKNVARMTDSQKQAVTIRADALRRG
jgi:deoxyribodipyrimidine photolyase-related protein